MLTHRKMNRLEAKETGRLILSTAQSPRDDVFYILPLHNILKKIIDQFFLKKVCLCSLASNRRRVESRLSFFKPYSGGWQIYNLRMSFCPQYPNIPMDVSLLHAWLVACMALLHAC